MLDPRRYRTAGTATLGAMVLAAVAVTSCSSDPKKPEPPAKTTAPMTAKGDTSSAKPGTAPAAAKPGTKEVAKADPAKPAVAVPAVKPPEPAKPAVKVEEPAKPAAKAPAVQEPAKPAAKAEPARPAATAEGPASTEFPPKPPGGVGGAPPGHPPAPPPAPPPRRGRPARGRRRRGEVPGTGQARRSHGQDPG